MCSIYNLILYQLLVADFNMFKEHISQNASVPQVMGQKFQESVKLPGIVFLEHWPNDHTCSSNLSWSETERVS